MPLPRAAVAPLFLVLSACSSSPSPASPSDAAAPDASVEAGVPCLLCREAGMSDAPVSVRVRGVVDQICANVDGCHGQGAGSLGMRPGAEFDAMIGVASSEIPTVLRVAPGDPAASYVYLKVACEGGTVGGCMPLSSGFDPALASMFREWIEAGAPTSP